VDVLLGTQMIAKGLDFPNVTALPRRHRYGRRDSGECRRGCRRLWGGGGGGPRAWLGGCVGRSRARVGEWASGGGARLARGCCWCVGAAVGGWGVGLGLGRGWAGGRGLGVCGGLFVLGRSVHRGSVVHCKTDGIIGTRGQHHSVVRVRLMNRGMGG
jgi:hypothetical protein